MEFKNYFKYLWKTMDRNLKTLGIVTRPQAGNGLWLSCLLPLCYMISTGKMYKQVGFDYKISTIICFGLMVQTVGIFIRLMSEKSSFIFNVFTKFLPGAFSSFLVWICLKQTEIFSMICGFGATLIYDFMYLYVMKVLPKSFTLGEGAIVMQGVTLFLFNAFLQLPSHYVKYETLIGELNIIKPVLQIGLLGLLIMIVMIHFDPLLRKWILFYPLLLSFVGLMIAIPDPKNVPQIYTLIDFMTKDNERMLIILIFALLVAMAVLTVVFFTVKNLQSSTSVRKIFHVLIICVFVPGIIYQCTLLFVASVLMLAVFIALETIRVIDLPPFSSILNTAVSTFLDEKDAGLIALTPIYLLIGCSLPLWIPPVPCDLTDSGGLEILKLFSGILSVGIGDMAASVIGSRFGKHKWKNSIKSVEGTLGSILFQILAVGGLWMLKLIHLNYLKILYTGVAIIVNALIEAKTDQVDNLMLPLITFAILSLA
uniref:dolichol kinase n=1 Tax=Culicoides sonorensis TaxID=179676 RepID=A0A336KFT3_CULSO